MKEIEQVSEILIFNAWGHSKYRISSHKLLCRETKTLPIGSLDFSFIMDKQMNGSLEACG
jgi:hypothetical protein